MRVLINSFGTHGDIQPFVALGKGLRQAGLRVAVCTSEAYRLMVEAHDLEYAFMK